MIDLRAPRRLGLAAVLILGLTACTTQNPADGRVSATAAHGAARAAESNAAATVGQPRSAHPTRVLKRVGVSLPLNRLATFIKRTGSVPNQLSIYQAWAAHQPFDAVAASAAKRRGMTILVTWEPWAPQCGCAKQPRWTDRRIASGTYDKYIRSYARSVKRFTRTGGHVTIRLGHEMNGNWYPWAVGANGNTPAAYLAMWRHVYRVFRSQHVPNVRWMWSPNLAYPGSKPMRSVYPGTKYVNDVGLSGYNFGAGQGFRWEKFSTLFQPSLNQLRSIAPHKRLYLAEIGCASNGGDKAKWIADTFRQVKQRPYIAGIIWFEQRTQRNWMIEDSRADVRAWEAGVALLQHR